MIDKRDLFSVKKNLEDIVGRRVNLISRKGRKKSIMRQGTIESTYPNIFTIRLDDELSFKEEGRRISFSYTDVLTKTVELALCSAGEPTAV